MPTLVPGRPLASREPAVKVENELPAGLWRFRLTVVDDEGNESAPAELTVKVLRAPTPPGPGRPPILSPRKKAAAKSSKTARRPAGKARPKK